MKKNDASRLWVQENIGKAASRRALEKIQSTGRALPCVVQSVDGQTVTVTFDVQSDVWALPPVTMPILTSVYDWIPVQSGTKGLTIPSDVYIDTLSGLGSEPSVLGSNPPNLSGLCFVPVANVGWTPPGGDPNMRVSQGPDGVLVQDLTGAVSGLFSKSSGITLTFGSDTVVMDSSGVTITAGSDTVTMNSSGVTITAGTINLVGNVTISGDLSSGTGSGGGTASFNGAITATGNITAGSIDLETHVHTGVTTGSGNTGGPTG